MILISMLSTNFFRGGKGYNQRGYPLLPHAPLSIVSALFVRPFCYYCLTTIRIMAIVNNSLY